MFTDQQLLARSLQDLRNRTIVRPHNGENTVLFTHQGKFEKAFGYWLPTGQTVIFQPDGTDTPRLIANLSFDEWANLQPRSEPLASRPFSLAGVVELTQCRLPSVKGV
jgi:hypothetical protein